MRVLFPPLLVLLLASCAWNAVLTPYAVKEARALTPETSATIWGFQDGTALYFTHVNGKGLPSRGGGGYPVSLSLAPGTHKIKTYFSGEGGWAYVEMTESVRAGHSYVVEYEVSPGKTHVRLRLKDLGTATRCHFERYRSFQGNSILVCDPPINP